MDAPIDVVNGATSDFSQDTSLSPLYVPGYGVQPVYNLQDLQEDHDENLPLPFITPGEETEYAPILEYIRLDMTNGNDIPIFTLTNERHVAQSQYYLWHRQDVIVRLDLRVPLGTMFKFKIVFIPKDSNTIRTLPYLVNSNGVILDTNSTPTIFLKIPWCDRRFFATASQSNQLGNLYILPLMAMSMSTTPEPFYMYFSNIPINMKFASVKPAQLLRTPPDTGLTPTVIGLKRRRVEPELKTFHGIDDERIDRLISEEWAMVISGGGKILSYFFPVVGGFISTAIDFVLPYITDSHLALMTSRGLRTIDFSDYLEVKAGSALKIVNVDNYFALAIEGADGKVVDTVILAEGDVEEPVPIPYEDPVTSKVDEIILSSIAIPSPDNLAINNSAYLPTSTITLSNVQSITGSIPTYDPMYFYIPKEALQAHDEINTISVAIKYGAVNYDMNSVESTSARAQFSWLDGTNPRPSVEPYFYYTDIDGKAVRKQYNLTLGQVPSALVTGKIGGGWLVDTLLSCPFRVKLLPIVYTTVGPTGKNRVVISFIALDVEILDVISKYAQIVDGDGGKYCRVHQKYFNYFYTVLAMNPLSNQLVSWNVLLSDDGSPIRDTIGFFNSIIVNSVFDSSPRTFLTSAGVADLDNTGHLGSFKTTQDPTVLGKGNTKVSYPKVVLPNL